MGQQLLSCPLFTGLSVREIEDCLACCQAVTTPYDREQVIFRPGDTPDRLLILLEGMVRVCSYTPSGERRVIASFDRVGELFGEVFLFLSDTPYEHFAEAASPARVLGLPRDFILRTDGQDYHARLVANVLAIFAQKAYFLNQRVQVLSCATLRQKLARLLLRSAGPDDWAVLGMNREALADFLGAARPSVSRELSHMQRDGLIECARTGIRLTDRAALEELV